LGKYLIREPIRKEIMNFRCHKTEIIILDVLIKIIFIKNKEIVMVKKLRFLRELIKINKVQNYLIKLNIKI
jgi:hypothetical protein